MMASNISYRRSAFLQLSHMQPAAVLPCDLAFECTWREGCLCMSRGLHGATVAFPRWGILPAFGSKLPFALVFVTWFRPVQPCAQFYDAIARRRVDPHRRWYAMTCVVSYLPSICKVTLIANTWFNLCSASTSRRCRDNHGGNSHSPSHSQQRRR